MRTAYDGLAKARSLATARVNGDLPSKTQQSFKEETDINVLVRRFGVTGGIPPGYQLPFWGVNLGEEIFDFRVAQDRLVEAQRSFMQLPADVRKFFDHDPVAFVKFAMDRKNLPKLREMGLAPAEKVPEPEKIQRVEIVQVVDGKPVVVTGPAPSSSRA